MKTEPLTFSTGGDALYRGQWDGWVEAFMPGDLRVGRIDYRMYEVWDDDAYAYRNRVDVKYVEVIPAYRRLGVATALYRKMFEETGLGPDDLGEMLRTPEGQEFRKTLKRRLMR